MNALEKFKDECKKIVGKNSKLLEIPPNNIADLALPCFAISKNPAEKAAELAEKFRKKIKGTMIKGIKAMGPYVNFYIDGRKFSQLALKEILKKKERYGAGKRKKERVMVEFCHANTHKAFHIGHVRNICIGESLSRILEFFGYDVVRANYQGDIGPHVARCMWGYMNLGMKEPRNTIDKGKWLGTVYSSASQKVGEDDEFIKEMTKSLYERKDKKLLGLWKKTRKWSLAYLNNVYRDFGVKFDRLYFESETSDIGIKLVKSLLKKKIAVVSEGAVILDLKKYGLGVFVLLRSDGAPLYSTKDFGLAELEFGEYKIGKCIHVVGSEQELYFRQLFKAFEFVNKEWAEKSRHMVYELVVLKEGKMSSRLGNAILYDDVLEEGIKRAEAVKGKGGKPKDIALAAIKYAMLNRSSSKTIVFDWDEALMLEGDTGPYLQYTYARAKSILRKAKKKSEAKSKDIDDGEAKLIKKLSEFPEIAEKSAKDLKPHYIANYLYELASQFNEFYHSSRVIGSENEEFRLGLTEAVAVVLKNGLSLLGISALEKM